MRLKSQECEKGSRLQECKRGSKSQECESETQKLQECKKIDWKSDSEESRMSWRWRWTRMTRKRR